MNFAAVDFPYDLQVLRHPRIRGFLADEIRIRVENLRSKCKCESRIIG